MQGVAISKGALLFHHLAVPNQKDEHSYNSTSESVAPVRSAAPLFIALQLQFLHSSAQEAFIIACCWTDCSFVVDAIGFSLRV